MVGPTMRGGRSLASRGLKAEARSLAASLIASPRGISLPGAVFLCAEYVRQIGGVSPLTRQDYFSPRIQNEAGGALPATPQHPRQPTTACPWKPLDSLGGSVMRLLWCFSSTHTRSRSARWGKA